MARTATLLAALVLALTLVACGDDDDDETTAAETTTAAEEPGGGGGGETTTGAEEPGGGGGETIQLSETEFAIDPSEVSAAAGDVTLEVTNDGSIPHDLEVEGGGVEEVTPTIDPGSTESLTVALEPGDYKIYCTIGDHEAQGMVGELTVE